MIKLKIEKLGDSLGLTLPRDLLAHLGAKEGDSLYVTETPDGFQLQLHEPEVDDQMSIAEDVMREDYDVLKKLAK